MFASLDFCTNLIMHHAEKNKNVYRLGRSVLKNILPRFQKRPSAKYFSSTDLPSGKQHICLYFNRAFSKLMP